MRKLKDEHIALICLSLAWFLILSGRYSIAALLKDIMGSLQISNTQAGIALSGMWLFYAIFQFPSGIFSDLKGRKISIMLAIFVFSVAYMVIGLSPHYLSFLFALILLGAGSGGYPSPSISMITDIFKEKKGGALGVRSSAGSLAYAVPVIAAALSAYYGWRTFFFLWSGVSFVSIYLFFKGTKESTELPEGFSIKQRLIDGVRVFRLKQIWLFFIINLLIAITWMGYMSFFPTFLQDMKSFTTLEASLSLLILGASGLFLKPLIGRFSDKYNKKVIIVIITAVASVANFILIFTFSHILIFFLSIFLAIAPAAFPVISSYLMDQWEEKGRAGKLGFYRSTLILLGSPASAIIGFLADEYNFNVPFLGISIILGVASLLLLSNLIYHKISSK